MVRDFVRPQSLLGIITPFGTSVLFLSILTPIGDILVPIPSS